MITPSAKLLRVLKIGDEIIVQDNEEQKRQHGIVVELGRNFLTVERVYPTGAKMKTQFPMHMIDTKEYEIFLKVS